jgi:hypothetical protein
LISKDHVYGRKPNHVTNAEFVECVGIVLGHVRNS